MKKLEALLLTAAMVIGLAACGNNQDPAASPTPSAPDPAVSAPSNAPASPSDTQTETAWPSGTLQWILAGTAGSGPDSFYRTLIPYLEEKWGVSIVPENVLWNAAVEQMMESGADGTYISNMPTPNAYKRHLDPNNEDDPSWEDTAVVCSVYNGWEVMALRTDDERFQDVNTLDEFVQWCKDHPEEQLLVGVKSALSTDDMTLYLLQGETGLTSDQLVHVTSTNASERNTSFLNGGVDLMLATSSEAVSPVRDGAAKIIASFSSERLDAFPDAPTAKECGIDVQQGSTNFIVMHPDTDPAIIQKFSQTVKEILEDPEVQQVFKNLGVDLYYKDGPDYVAELKANEAALSEVKSMWGW